MIEIDEEMEEWGTERAEGPKIWVGAIVIYCVFLLLFYFLFRQNLGGGHDPLDPLLPAPQGKESKISSEWVPLGGEHLLGYSFMYICTRPSMYLWVSPVRGPGEYMKKRVGKRY